MQVKFRKGVFFKPIESTLPPADFRSPAKCDPFGKKRRMRSAGISGFLILKQRLTYFSGKPELPLTTGWRLKATTNISHKSQSRPQFATKLFGLGVVDAGCHKRYLFFDLFAHFVETPFFKLIVNSFGYTFDFTTRRILCPP